MSTSRHYLVPLLLIAPLNILCAKLLLTPERIDGFDVQIVQRGWPWMFHETASLARTAMPSSEFKLFWFLKLIADLAVLGGFIAICAMLLVWRLRRRGGRLQLSLRGLLVLMAIVAASFAWWFHEWNYSKRQEKFLTQFNDILVFPETLPGPLWLQRLTGNNRIFERIVAIHNYQARIADKKFRAALSAAIVDLPSIRRISMNWDSPLAADELELLSPFEEIQPFGRFFDDDTVSLLRKLPKLRVLDLRFCNLTNQQLFRFAELRHLQRLIFPSETDPKTFALLKRRSRNIEIALDNSIIEDTVVSPEMNAILSRAVHDFIGNVQPENKMP